MRPPLWHPPVKLSTAEHAIIKRIRRAKLFVFLRHHRHTLFADPLQRDFSPRLGFGGERRREQAQGKCHHEPNGAVPHGRLLTSVFC